LGTEQKPHGRVQTLPKIMKVAVFCDQHSSRLGHLALSQTVSSRKSSISRDVNCNPPPLGKLRFSQRGKRGEELGKVASSVMMGRSTGTRIP
jgi:hypothetical protein